MNREKPKCEKVFYIALEWTNEVSFNKVSYSKRKAI